MTASRAYSESERLHASITPNTPSTPSSRNTECAEPLRLSIVVSNIIIFISKPAFQFTIELNKNGMYTIFAESFYLCFYNR